jgi:gliding motility-associated-like protein
LSATLSATDVICNGDSTGVVFSNVSGGSAPYSYSWSNGSNTPNIHLVPAMAYTLNVVDAQGCTAFTGAVVNQPPALVLTPTITDASCFGASNGQIVLEINGGEQPYYFSWGNQNEIVLNVESETISNIPAANYYIQIKDKNNCAIEQYILVGQPAMQTANVVVSDVLCFSESNGSIDVTYSGGTLPYTTSWSSGQATEDLSNLVAGYYSFTGTDAQGCIVRDIVFVDEPELIRITSEIIALSCVNQTDAAIDINAFGGTAPYAYMWSNGQITQNVSDLNSGFYSLVVTDDNSCSQAFNFEIMVSDNECLDIPNTLTPNGDNYNDTWVIENIDLYSNAVVKIFNKWGNEIYSSNQAYIPWDGTFNGNPLPSEVYYYIIELNNSENNNYTGTITIIR